MSYRRGVAFASLGLVLAAAAPAQAQIGTYVRPQINPRPTVSPYLNMQRGGNAAINYYGVVRPQLETNRALFQLQQDVQMGQVGVAVALDPNQNAAILNTGQTGHPVSFFNYSHYYGNRGGGGGSGGTTPIAGGAGNPIGRPNPGVRPIIAVGTGN